MAQSNNFMGLMLQSRVLVSSVPLLPLSFHRYPNAMSLAQAMD
jgi:hypothetical protein